MRHVCQCTCGVWGGGGGVLAEGNLLHIHLWLWANAGGPFMCCYCFSMFTSVSEPPGPPTHHSSKHTHPHVHCADTSSEIPSKLLIPPKCGTPPFSRREAELKLARSKRRYTWAGNLSPPRRIPTSRCKIDLHIQNKGEGMLGSGCRHLYVHA